jgi:kumamolisin
MPRAIQLAGSYRSKPKGAVAVGDVDDRERIAVTLYLKDSSATRHVPGSAADLAVLTEPVSRRSLARQRAKQYAAAAAAVARFAKRNRLAIGRSNLTRRTIVLKGTAAQMRRAFGAVLGIYEDDRRRFRARSGSLRIPPAIARWTRAVLGFDRRPQVTPRRLRSLVGTGDGAGLWPTEVARLYGIPLDHDGAGQCIGIVALGGGFLTSDLSQSAAGTGRPVPVVVEQSVAGASNDFGSAEHPEADEEIALDLQVLAAIVPGARIVVYFAPNTAAGLAEGIHQAVFDTVNRPQILSISWGSAEKFWNPAARDAMQAALADAVRLRLTVTAAAGDLLATGGLSDDAAHVFFPASSPYVLGCGGTNVTPRLDGGAITSESVWNDGLTGTGGGISDTFPIPVYQANVPLPPSVNDGRRRRGVPDVAAAAARTPGYRIILAGHPIVKDGTSAVAPLWAALIALANARRGAPSGLVNPVLYANPVVLRAITQGNNRVHGKGYDAGAPWNACTGLGVPMGADVIAALAALPIA